MTMATDGLEDETRMPMRDEGELVRALACTDTVSVCVCV